MRLVEQDIINAMRFGVSFVSGTSSSYKPDAAGHRDNLTFDKNTFSYKLWGNEIAKGNTDTKEITVSDCGYPTATTTSRLNALFAGLDIPMSASVRKKTVVYSLNGHPVNVNSLEAGSWKVTIA